MVALLVAFFVTAWFQTAPAAGTLDAIDGDARAGVYGNVDRLLIIRKGPPSPTGAVS